MSENGPLCDAQACSGAARHGSVCDVALLVLVLLILVRTGHASAGEQISVAAGPLTPDLHARGISGREPAALNLPTFELPGTYQAAFDLPRNYRATDSAAGDSFFPRDFRPRAPSALEGQSRVEADDMPMLHGTSVWQRLADYRSHGRVRLLTLWETGGSSVSLQAGRKGEPSLQWISRSMNRGGATRGVFDQLVSVSVAGANRSFHPASHPGPIEAAPRPGKPADIGIGTNK